MRYGVGWGPGLVHKLRGAVRRASGCTNAMPSGHNPKVSIVGPGARPYRRNRQFAPLAEHLCGYLMEPRPEAIVAIERALFNTVLDVIGKAYFDIFSYNGRVVVFKLIAAAQKH